MMAVCSTIALPINRTLSISRKHSLTYRRSTVVCVGRTLLINRTASQNSTHVSFESGCTIRTSWEHPCDRDHQLMMERRDRVGNVALGSDRRRRGVGNYREWQVF